jgi:ATP-dependent Zn protease
MTPAVMPTKSLEVVAYHEAGHAVAAVGWGVGHVDSVTIVPARNTRGRTCISPYLADAPEHYEAARDRRDEVAASLWRAVIVRHVRFFLAGPCAEDLFTKRRTVHRLCSPDTLNAGFRVDLVEGDDKVERSQTRTFLRQNWLHVEAVAAALLRHKTLTGRRFYEVVGGMGTRRIAA